MAERSTGDIGVMIFLISLIVVGLLLAVYSWPHPSPPEYSCCNHLKQIGGLLLARQAGGELEYVEGEAFLLQVRNDIRPEHLKVFRCPEGPEDVFINYRGPDRAALERLRTPGSLRSVIIACDANGENGDEPHHDDGVCVLWNSGKVEFIPWEDMEGYDGGPVKVGPGSPDPRFRHLVR